MDNKMFRYLEKYVGTYRVLPILDEGTGDFPRDESGGIAKDYDDLYIPCAKGIIKHTYVYPYLVWYTDKIKTGKKIKEKLEALNVDIYYEETDFDSLIWFKDKDIKTVAKLVKPKTNGKKISPFSKRNLVKEEKEKYIIPLTDLDKYSEIIKDLDFADKLKFSKSIMKEFCIGNVYDDKKYSDNDRDESGLSYKEYIHYCGKWDEFIKYAKKEYKEYTKGE